MVGRLYVRVNNLPLDEAREEIARNILVEMIATAIHGMSVKYGDEIDKRIARIMALTMVTYCNDKIRELIKRIKEEIKSEGKRTLSVPYSVFYDNNIFNEIVKLIELPNDKSFSIIGAIKYNALDFALDVSEHDID